MQLRDFENKRHDIQALRALAVVAVVFYHAQVPGLSGGYVGVDVFFVISGFLITTSLFAERERTGSIDLAAFYGRRLRRLLPAAMVVLLTTGVCAMFLLSPVEQRTLARTLLFAALYSVNILFAIQATDYLAQDAHVDPLLHMWSLSVEEQFYLIWPLLVLFAGLLRFIAVLRERVLAMTVLILLVSFLTSLWMFSVSQPWAFFAAPFRAWEFASGGLVALLTGRPSALTNPRHFARPICVVGLCAIGCAIVVFDDATSFPNWAAVAPVAGTAMVLWSNCLGSAILFPWTSCTPIQRLGDLSYSWYLWHWPLLVLPGAFGALSSGMRAILVAASLGLAWLTYHLVENPVRFHPRLRDAPRRSLLAGACMSVAALSGALALHWAGVAGEALPGQSAIAAIQAELTSQRLDQCHADAATTTLGSCEYGRTDSKRTVFLVGDSHAAHWFPALERLAQENQFRLVALTKTNCPIADVSPMIGSQGRQYEECTEWRRAVLKRIQREQPFAVVIGQISQYVRADKHRIDDPEWTDGMRRSVASIARATQHVFVLRDTPWVGFDVPTCLSRAYARGDGATACRFPFATGFDQRVVALDRKALAGLDNARIIDLTSVFCSTKSCEVVIDETIVFRDVHHLTIGFSRNAAPALWRVISPHLAIDPAG